MFLWKQKEPQPKATAHQNPVIRQFALDVGPETQTKITSRIIALAIGNAREKVATQPELAYLSFFEAIV